MGRELKRVPLDFQWPMNKPWIGYINPHYKGRYSCVGCSGSGETIAALRLGDLVSLLMLSGDDAGRGKCHPYLRETPLYSTQGMSCGVDMLELTAALAGRSPSCFGHDACDKWSAKKKIIAAAGLPETWGVCPSCGGSGEKWDSEEIRLASENWTKSDPPAGDGFQIWETVSEGSPISPVFATAEELAQHMSTTRWGADKGSSAETWLKFINGPGWAPSMISDASGVHDGVAHVGMT